MKQDQTPSRRQFLKQTGSVAAATTLVTAAPKVHAAEDNKIRVVLIGCGGRGTGAALNALTVANGPHLAGLADVFETNLTSTYAALAGPEQVG
ncbi:MAG: twin-arginine translocation signal domain-containing protein, partial [Deltaproteobacteria bacterium]|nr:twin-arginine translocation signal domain-containing protein [Deltaproteobacteria bacterium]